MIIECFIAYARTRSDPSENILPQEIRISREGFTLLGCPIGPPSYLQRYFDEKSPEG